MIKKNNAQFAIEFIVLISFMFLIFLGFIAIITSTILYSKDSERQGIAEDIATMVRNEIELAKSVSDGYTRTFSIPTRIQGNSYAIEIIDNRELVVNYVDKEFVSFLPEKICGDIFITNNEIDKEKDLANEKGVICLNSNLDLTQCQNAADPGIGLCDGLDDELLPGTKCCCCQRYGICC